MKRITKRIFLGAGILVILLLCLAAAGVGLYIYATRPFEDGATLAGGAITTVVADRFGPVAIGAYVFELGDGSVGLIDAGMDREAPAIHAAIKRLGKAASDVRAVFLTHAHDDHFGGVLAFPNAEVYAIEPDAGGIRRLRERSGVAPTMTKSVKDSEHVQLASTRIEVYALPGHTPGSAAYLVHGVLFLGDTAQGMRYGNFGSNTMFSDDADSSDRSLKALATRLEPRKAEIGHIAFGHSGPLEGLAPLLKWASGGR